MLNRRSRLRIAVRSIFLGISLFGLAALMVSAGPVPAQDIDALSERRQATEHELEELRSEISVSEQEKAQLTAEIDALEKDRATINRQLIDTSARTRDLQEKIDRAASRLEELREQETTVKGNLGDRRSVLIEVIAALQRMGREPPPALLVNPGDALTALRSAMLLGAVVPGIREETEILATELHDLKRITTDIAARRSELSADLDKLASEEERLSLLLEEKKSLTADARESLARQTARAAKLAGEAGSLEALIASLGKEIEAVKEAEQAAAQAAKKREQEEIARLADARQRIEDPRYADADRIQPAIPFEDARGLLPKPVSGVELVSFGQTTKSGQVSGGISLAARSGSRVLAPSDGWVIYAGPFRSYGQLLIVNAGDDYHIVMAGMERIDVSLGQFILAGEPVGVMSTRRVASVNNFEVGTLRPVLYVEFRKNGKSIDPSPWWADSSLEERS